MYLYVQIGLRANNFLGQKITYGSKITNIFFFDNLTMEVREVNFILPIDEAKKERHHKLSRFYYELVKDIPSHLHFIIDVDYWTRLPINQQQEESWAIISKYFEDTSPFLLKTLPEAKLKRVKTVSDECKKSGSNLPFNLFDDIRNAITSNITDDEYRHMTKPLCYLVLYNHFANNRPCELPKEVRVLYIENFTCKGLVVYEASC